MAREISQNQAYGANSDNVIDKPTSAESVDTSKLISVGQKVETQIDQRIKKYVTSSDEFRYVIKIINKSMFPITNIKITDDIPNELIILKEYISGNSINSTTRTGGNVIFKTKTVENNKITMEIEQIEGGHYLEIYVPVKVIESKTKAPDLVFSIVNPSSGEGTGTGEGTGSDSVSKEKIESKVWVYATLPYVMPDKTPDQEKPKEPTGIPFKSMIITGIDVIIGTAINVEQSVQKELETGGYVDVTLDDGIGYFTSNDKLRYVIKVTRKPGIDNTITDIQIVDAVPLFFEFEQREITCKSINSNDLNEPGELVGISVCTEKVNKEKQYYKTIIETEKVEAGHYLEIYIPVTVPASTTEQPKFGSAIVSSETSSTDTYF